MMRQGVRQRAFVPVCAAAHGDRLRQQRVDRGIPAKERKRMPETGYFAAADPHAEVRNPGGFVEKLDVKKRGGRYQSDFIWNVDWETQFDKDESMERARKRYKDAGSPQVEGGLGLSRKHDLNSMDVDLSDALKQPRPDPFAAFRRNSPESNSASLKSSTIKPTQADSRRWDRSGKFVTRAPAPTLDEDQAAALQQEIDDYNKMKADFQMYNLVLSLVGLLSVWATTSREGAISYAIGAAGSFMYLRMLNRTMDDFGGSGGLGAALGQPRLLIPIILAMGYHRWNHSGNAEEFGLTLQLLPMLLGFFTYKGAVITRQGAALFSELSSSFKNNEVKAQS